MPHETASVGRRVGAPTNRAEMYEKTRGQETFDLPVTDRPHGIEWLGDRRAPGRTDARPNPEPGVQAAGEPSALAPPGVHPLRLGPSVGEGERQGRAFNRLQVLKDCPCPGSAAIFVASRW